MSEEMPESCLDLDALDAAIEEAKAALDGLGELGARYTGCQFFGCLTSRRLPR